MNHFLILGSIITGCGLLGGIINYFRVSISFSSSNYIFLKSLITGLGASALVPLFLKMISSDLLGTSINNPIEYFVIGGFCLIASISSAKFIDSVGEKLQIQMDQVVKEVQEVKNDLDEISTENELDNLPEIKAEYENLGYEKKEMLSVTTSAPFLVNKNAPVRA